MLLTFPTGVSDNTFTIKSVDKTEFKMKLNEKVNAGWDILKVTSEFRKTLFGGITSYKAELRRGSDIK